MKRNKGKQRKSEQMKSNEQGAIWRKSEGKLEEIWQKQTDTAHDMSIMKNNYCSQKD